MDDSGRIQHHSYPDYCLQQTKWKLLQTVVLIWIWYSLFFIKLILLTISIKALNFQCLYYNKLVSLIWRCISLRNYLINSFLSDYSFHGDWNYGWQFQRTVSGCYRVSCFIQASNVIILSQLIFTTKIFDCVLIFLLLDARFYLLVNICGFWKNLSTYIYWYRYL